MSARPLNVGLIGGGGGAFIAQPHQKAIHFDGTRRVVCGALHPDPKVAMEEAENWQYPIKGYPSYDELIAEESKKPVGERVDYVLVCTPNHVHFDPAMKCIKAGIPVFCEKPLTIAVDEAQQLVDAVKEAKIPFGVAHTYLGHWTSRFCRFIIQSGLLGNVRWVDAYYLQGWLAERTEDKGVMQAEWRVDPDRAGASNCGGDIGTHAYMQLRYVTGLEVTAVSARLEKFLPGRLLDDHFTAYVELSNGGRGMVRASQIAVGHKNDLGIEVNCAKGSLRWRQEDADKVTVCLLGQPDRDYWRGCVEGDDDGNVNDGFLGQVPQWILDEPTIPFGHVEAFHDAFARLHRCFEADVRAFEAGEEWACDGSKYANVEDGLKHMKFVKTAVESSNAGGAKVEMA